MSPPRIELADPSPEGQRIAEVLRERGFYVVERSIESLTEGSDAQLVLLGGDAEGAIDALSALRLAEKNALAPLILLGDPPDRELSSTKAILALGADAHYSRPVSIERLVRKVETFLAPPETRLKSQPHGEHESEPPPPRPEMTMQLAERDPSVADWRPPEPTLQLSGDKGGEPLPPIVTSSRPVTPVSETSHRSSRPPLVPVDRPSRISDRPSRPPVTPSQPPIGTPPSGNDRAAALPAVDLSPRLRRLILDADRRVFPASSPLDLRFAAGDEAPEELVPDELLEVVAISTEQVEEDPLDAFTYVGPVPQHSLTPLPGGAPDPNRAWLSAPSESAVSVRAELSPPRTSVTYEPSQRRAREASEGGGSGSRPALPRSMSDTQDEIGFGERTAGGRGRRGDLGEADAFRLLWRIVETGDEVWLSLSLEGLPPLRMRIAGDDLRVLDGPVASRALAWLAERGRADLADPPADEVAATAALEKLVARGTLGRYELDRVLRLARESILHDVVVAGAGSFELRPAGTSSAPGPKLLAQPLAWVLVEGARRRMTPARLRRLLGSGELALALSPIAAQRFERIGIEPELAALLARSDGETLDAVLAAAPAEEGIAGAIYALVAAGGLRLVAPERNATHAGSEDPRSAVRAAITSAAALAEDAHYFQILGIPPHAAPREVRAAFEARRRELSDLRLGALGLDELEPRLRLALEAVDEAFEVLSDPGLCEAYRHALAI